MDIKEVFVDYETYCPTCKHCNRSEVKEPCNTCLDYPMNEGSKKPTEWKEKE